MAEKKYTENLGLTQQDETDFVDVDELSRSFLVLDEVIGSLETLDTEEKENLVGAVNEVKGEVSKLNSDLDGWKLGTITVSGTTDEYGQIRVNNPFGTTRVVCIQNVTDYTLSPLPIIAISYIAYDDFVVRVSRGGGWWKGEFNATLLCAYK